VASLPVMNLSLPAIFTVEVIFAYVIWGQELAEELRAIRRPDRSGQVTDARLRRLIREKLKILDLRVHGLSKCECHTSRTKF